MSLNRLLSIQYFISLIIFLYLLKFLRVLLLKNDIYCSLCIAHIALEFVCRNEAELGKILSSEEGFLKLAFMAFDELHLNVCTIPSNTPTSTRVIY